MPLMHWHHKFTNYWELTDEQGAVYGLISKGRKTFFCQVNGKQESFSARGFTFEKLEFYKAKKWCEKNVNKAMAIPAPTP